MAKLEDKEITLKMVFSKGETNTGKKKLMSLSIKNINKGASDDDIYQLANELASLQSLPLLGIHRLQSEIVVDE
ncbi:MAG: hypothetical protein PEPC_01366 [Peptostreptococcus russellii]|uniref:DUF1659 domain-containing protein n=1 Tax=Peptostreptococcus russellii TaxID=215200 RepID=A0A2P7PZ21_9FIRM|nr:DUF1659 domain-containing protein [Peptostreptococcus russellii]PSJ30966.1 hypothetical protein UF10_08940 [Peptostreptococcus russellii]